MIKHAAPEIRDPVIREFIEKPVLGGMMITEPTGGTDMFALRSHYTQTDKNLTLSGVKCWGGLTGLAEHWLVAARLQRGDRYSKKINLIYIPLPHQGVSVRSQFDALGLQPISYGQTTYDQVRVPCSYVMGSPLQSGLRVIYDTLFRSRLGMPAISAGHCRRLAHEVRLRIQDRSVFGVPLAHYDQVQFRLEDLEAMAYLNQRLWQFSGAWMNDHADISGDYTLVNATKLICSDTIQTASDSAMQIFASAAYKRNHLVGRGYVDSRPFPIFEGSNDVLDENLYDTLSNGRGGLDIETVSTEFSRFGLSFPHDLHPTIPGVLAQSESLSQRKKVVIGRVLAWLLVRALLDSNGEDKQLAAVHARCLAHRKIASLVSSLEYLS